MLMGISGCATSLSASRSLILLSSAIMRGSEGVEFLLEHRDHFHVARAARAPADEDVVPRARGVEIPVLCLGVEGAGVEVVKGEFVVRRVFVRMGGEPDLVAHGRDDG